MQGRTYSVITMINLVEMRRNHTNWAIQQNGFEIELHRVGETRKGGKIQKINETLPPQLFRIYVKGGSETQHIDTQGERQTDRYYRLLASWDADIQASTTVTDTLEWMGDKYIVKSVYHQSINGQVVGKQCELERVM